MSPVADGNDPLRPGRTLGREELRGRWHISFFDISLLLVIVFVIITAVVIGIGVSHIPPEPQLPNLPHTESGIDDPVRKLIVRFEDRGTSRKAYLLDKAISSVEALEKSIEKLNAGDVTEYDRLIESGLRCLNTISPQDRPCERALKAITKCYGPFQRNEYIQYIEQGPELASSFREKIQGAINDLKNQREEQIRVHVKADTNTPYGFIVDIFKLCQNLRFTDLYFDVSAREH